MNVYRLLQQAWLNLLSAKLRSFLAVLGILVGTASVVALINCGQLATEKALAQFKALGTDLLAVSIFQQNNQAASSSKETIPLSFWRKLPLMMPDILRIAPYNTSYQSMSMFGRTITGSIIGADESLARILHIQLKSGRFVSSAESFEHVCVIGDGVAQQINRMRLVSPEGQQLRIGQALYTVIGVISPWKENGFFNEDINQSVIIPIAGMALINQDASINNAVVLLKPNRSIEPIIEQLKQRIHEQAPKLSLFVRSAKQIIASMQSQGRIFTLLLAVIGSISLLVGGIGIMNIMLVSVTERTQEIGLRKAIGATQQDILLQFMIEAVIVSVIGGFVGTAVGVSGIILVAAITPLEAAISSSAIATAVGVSGGIGLFFGVVPARRAAQLDPIVALRSA